MRGTLVTLWASRPVHPYSESTQRKIAAVRIVAEFFETSIQAGTIHPARFSISRMARAAGQTKLQGTGLAVTVAGWGGQHPLAVWCVYL
jgi:hypothetical protein